MLNVNDLEKWALESVSALRNGSDGCYYYSLGKSCCKTNEMFLVIGWMDGFEENTSDNPNTNDTSRICMKLAYNCDDLQCDFDVDWEMPYDEETGYVDDTCAEFDLGSVGYLFNYWKRHYRQL